jgi:starch-binding outer membrane protein, SusD/RagB family
MLTNSNRTMTFPGYRRAGRALAGTSLGFSLALGAGCGDILSLEQSNPTQVDAASLYVPANAQLLVNGAIADFECAYTRYVLGSGILSDEVGAAIAQTANFDYDRRTFNAAGPYAGGCGAVQQPGFYTAMSTARADGDTVYARMSAWTDAQVPNREKLLGQLMAYAGYSLIILGEGMCSAAINVGPELSSAQLFEEAKLRFDKAVTHATTANDAATLNMARLGRARALRNLKNLPAAAADAALIPATFVVNTSMDVTNVRRQNPMFIHITQSFFGTVESSFRNLTLGAAADPRVAVTNSGRVGTAASTPIWTPNKYPAANSPVPVARYAEAQLIIAEARIAAGDLPGAAAAINAARNSTGRTGLPLYDATGQTADQVRTQLIEERRRELFLEGHRLWDIRHFNLPLSPPAGAAYPAGGGTYADLRCFPLPNVERNNNPNIPKT